MRNKYARASALQTVNGGAFLNLRSLLSKRASALYSR